MIFRLLLLMVIGGGIMIYFGIQGQILHSASSETPQNITCEKLGDNGPGDNVHVSMSGFNLLLSSFIFHKDSKTQSNWSYIWIPAVPANPDPARSQSFKILVKSSEISDETNLRSFASQNAITGMVINSIHSLTDKERELLQQHYPNVDLDKAILLEANKKPMPTAAIFGLLFGGLILIFAGVAVIFRRWKGNQQAKYANTVSM